MNDMYDDGLKEITVGGCVTLIHALSDIQDSLQDLSSLFSLGEMDMPKSNLPYLFADMRIDVLGDRIKIAYFACNQVLRDIEEDLPPYFTSVSQIEALYNAVNPISNLANKLDQIEKGLRSKGSLKTYLGCSRTTYDLKALCQDDTLKTMLSQGIYNEMSQVMSYVSNIAETVLQSKAPEDAL